MRALRYFLPILGIFLLSSQLTLAQQVAQQEPNDQNGEFRYVSDNLFTYIRSGPGDNYRLLGSVNAGTKIQVLQINESKGYAEIIDDRQRTGWIELQYVSPEPSLKEEVVTLRTQVAQDKQTRESQQSKLNKISSSLTKVEQQRASLNRQVTQQLEDIARLNEQALQRERSNKIEWFTRGAILAIVALVLGYIMGLIGRKRKDHNRIM